MDRTATRVRLLCSRRLKTLDGNRIFGLEWRSSVKAFTDISLLEPFFVVRFLSAKRRAVAGNSGDAQCTDLEAMRDRGIITNYCF